MITIASAQFGCTSGDVICYCTDGNFANGVRDCANQACPDLEDADATIEFAEEYCDSTLDTHLFVLTTSNALLRSLD